MSLLVIEGIDGAGKTTVAQALAARGYAYRHVGPPGQGGSFTELLASWWADIRNGPEFIVYDRGHLGELVYGPARCRTLTVGERNALSALLLSANAEVIWMDAPPSVCLERVQKRPGEGATLVQLQRERILFKDAIDTEVARTRRATSAASFLEHWRSELHHRPDPNLDPRGMGAACPTWWVVGEQLSRRSPTRAPFTTPMGLNMVWNSIDPRRVRVTNALASDSDLEAARRGRFDPRDLAYLSGAWEGLRGYRPWGYHPLVKTIALGRTAAAALRAAELPVDEELEHPQHALRFGYSTRDGWRYRLARLTEPINRAVRLPA